MIVIQLRGGLGNQLFSYALGVALNHRSQQVKYDTSLLDHDPGRKYLLDTLGLDLLPAHEVIEPIIYEGSLRFQPRFLEVNGYGFPCTLSGFFQSEMYFLDPSVQYQIRSSIHVKKSSATRIVAGAIERCESCFIHVRRTDNLRPDGLAVHGLLPLSYFKRAVAIIQERLPEVQFFVFSDDPEWCQEQNLFNRPEMTIVSHNRPSVTVDANYDIHRAEGGRECEDLYLMSLCRHAIISNSTFSYWGAWLNAHESDVTRKRIVLAPQEWFKTKELDSTDIVPARWAKISI